MYAVIRTCAARAMSKTGKTDDSFAPVRVIVAYVFEYELAASHGFEP
jgi:hypothetical protein